MTQAPSPGLSELYEELRDDECARDMEEALSGVYDLHMIWMQATGRTRTEAREAFAKARNTEDFMNEAVDAALKGGWK